MMVDRLLNYTPDGKLTVFKSGLFGAQRELQVLTLQVSVFLAYEREHHSAAVTIKLTATSHLDVR